MNKSIVIAIIVATMAALTGCQSSCNCGYAQNAPQQSQMETNL